MGRCCAGAGTAHCARANDKAEPMTRDAPSTNEKRPIVAAAFLGSHKEEDINHAPQGATTKAKMMVSMALLIFSDWFRQGCIGPRVCILELLSLSSVDNGNCVWKTLQRRSRRLIHRFKSITLIHSVTKSLPITLISLITRYFELLLLKLVKLPEIINILIDSMTIKS